MTQERKDKIIDELLPNKAVEQLHSTTDIIKSIISNKQRHKRDDFDDIEGFDEMKKKKSSIEKELEKTLSKVNSSKIRLEKVQLSEYEKRMQRIRRVKSRGYKKVRRREMAKTVELVEKEKDSSNSDSDSSDEELEPKNVLPKINKSHFNHKFSKEENSEKILESLFEEKGREIQKDFDDEKKTCIKEEMPEKREIVLPGWGSWGGQKLENKKNKFNTINFEKKGIEITKRKDFDKKNIIINEKVDVPDKYKSKIPKKMTESQYRQKINTPISKECNTIRDFDKILNDKKLSNDKKVSESYRFFDKKFD